MHALYTHGEEHSKISWERDENGKEHERNKKCIHDIEGEDNLFFFSCLPIAQLAMIDLLDVMLCYLLVAKRWCSKTAEYIMLR